MDKFSFHDYLDEIGFKMSKLDSLRYYRKDGYNLRIIPDNVVRVAELYNSRLPKAHIANFLIPNNEGDANTLFKYLRVNKFK